MSYRKDVEVVRICGCTGAHEVCDKCQGYPGDPKPPEPLEPPALPKPPELGRCACGARNPVHENAVHDEDCAYASALAEADRYQHLLRQAEADLATLRASHALPDPTPPSKPLPLDLSRPGNVGQYDMSSPFEPIKIIEHYNLNFSLGNVIKYVLRAGKKPGVADIEDLKKARQYLDFEIARQQANAGANRG